MFAQVKLKWTVSEKRKHFTGTEGAFFRRWSRYLRVRKLLITTFFNKKSILPALCEKKNYTLLDLVVPLDITQILNSDIYWALFYIGKKNAEKPAKISCFVRYLISGKLGRIFMILISLLLVFLIYILLLFFTSLLLASSEYKIFKYFKF